MTTSYPTALDSLTNPASGDSTSSPSHAAQHANANDAIEAIEAKLGHAASTDATFDARDFGVVPGAADNTTALLAALAAMQARNGGRLVLPPGTIRANGQLLIPNDAVASYPSQKSTTWIGAGASPNGRSAGVVIAPAGGTILDLRYTGGGTNQPKILTTGFGKLEVSGITFTDGGTSSNPFFKTTNTTVHIHDNFFYGNAAKSLLTCDQDAIVLGGTNQAVGDATSEGAFQGYGSVIENNGFNRIRRGVLLQNWANNVVIRDNMWWGQCGGSAAGAVEFAANFEHVFGCLVAGNLFETGGYPYPILADRAQNNVFLGNGFYDPSVNTLAYIRFATAEAKFNHVITGFGDGAKPHVSDVALTNTVFASAFADTSQIVQPMHFIGGASLRADGWGAGAVATFDSNSPGTAAKVAFENYGRTWHYQGLGGGLVVDTGTGGSYLDLKGYGVRFYDHTGALKLTVMEGVQGTGTGIKFGPSGDASLKGGAGVISTNTTDVFLTGLNATGSRPNPLVGQGCQFYDTTLHKPIWSDGTNWRDAMGNVV